MAEPVRDAAGRPLALDLPYRIREDGTTQTKGERIIELMGTGSHVDTAAGSIGIVRSVLHKYLQAGARCRSNITRGKLSDPDDLDGEAPLPDAFSLRCMTFTDAVDSQVDAWIQRQEVLFETATRGLKRTVTITNKDAGGQITGSSERVEIEPDMATARWRATRRAPKLYGDRQALELSGPDGEPIAIEDRTESLLDKIRKARQTKDQPPEEPS